jgi:hypothetical protein
VRMDKNVVEVEVEVETDSASIVANNNEMIDKLTLELLMNKSHYKRYIANADPTKHAEMVKHNALITKYKYKIMNITNELLSDPSKQITTSVNEAFNGYVKTLIQYFQMKEFENKSNEHSDEDDVMFGSIDEDVCNAVESEQSETVEPIMKSFWGGSRVVKQKQNINGRSNNQMF